jgi:hypothetical protein
MARQKRTARKRQPENDSQNRTGRTGQAEQEQAEQDRQNRTGRLGQAGLDYQYYAVKGGKKREL